MLIEHLRQAIFLESGPQADLETCMDLLLARSIHRDERADWERAERLLQMEASA